MNRYSFTGNGTLLLKTVSQGKYGDKDYLANEPIAYFTELSINLNYSVEDKVATAGTKNLTLSSNSSPSILRVENLKVTDSLQSLLYKRKDLQTKTKTEVKILTSNDNIMFLPIAATDVVTSDVFVYNTNKLRMEGWTLEDDKIIGLPDGTYTVFYSITRDAVSTFSLNNINIPYLSGEINITGNLNGVEGIAVIHLPKLKITSRPSLDFTNENPFVTELEFVVIDDKEEVEVTYYYG